MTLDEIADRLIEWSTEEARVKALWIEAGTLSDLRRPYRAARFHLTADEPEYPSLLAELRGGLRCLQGSKVLSVKETPRFANELTLEVDGVGFSLVAEQSHLLAKRPRAEVVPLIDKTRHLTHVMDFSGRNRK